MDLSYFQEPVEVLVAEAQYSEEGELTSPAVYETKQQIKKRPRTKSYDDVIRVIEKHKGKNDAVVDTFITSYLDGIQWDWLATYQEWQVACSEIESWNTEFAGTVSHTETVRTVTGEGEEAVVSYEEQEVLYEAKELPVEPVRPPVTTVDQWKLQNYSMLRAAAYPSQEEQLGMQYDDTVNNTNTWVEAQQAIKNQYPKELLK